MKPGAPSGATRSGLRVPPSGPGPTRAHVFVVDDNPHVLELCHCYVQQGEPLGPAGLRTEVHFAASGEEALRAAAELIEAGECVAYCVLDFVLPEGIDGLETISRLWELDPDIHCTLVTGAGARIESEIEDRLPADLLDRWDYLAKPFKRFEFLLAVRRALSNWYIRRLGAERTRENELLLERLEVLNHNLEKTVLERTLALARRTDEQTRKAAELEDALRRLEDTQAQALQQDRMASIGQLAAGVAHELANPIGCVHSNLNTLSRSLEKVSELIRAYESVLFRADGADRPELADLRKRLKVDYLLEDLATLTAESLEGTERVRRIVSDLQGFSGPDDSTPREVDLNEGLEAALNVLRNEIKYKADVHLELEGLPAVRCLPGPMNQVFLNLLVNAAQAIEENGAIHVRTAREGDEVVIRIADTGRGIAPEDRQRIFEPFFTTKGPGVGTGLGLPVARDVVRRHGGRLDFESELGRGTCFTLRLPIDGRGLGDGGA